MYFRFPEEPFPWITRKCFFYCHKNYPVKLAYHETWWIHIGHLFLRTIFWSKQHICYERQKPLLFHYVREEKKLNRVKYAQYCNKLNFRNKPFPWRTFSLNNGAQNRRQAFFQIILGCHISNYVFIEDCAELITDPRKVFDSFSVFVEPISYQRILRLASVFYITAYLVKYLKYSSLWFRLDGR